MIFVTVGTHEQQFNRLVCTVDELVESGQIKDKVYIQIGYSTYIPRQCEWSRFLSVEEMSSKMKAADIVITHGGPSSFIEAMSMGKTPIVVPRLSAYGEHVNDHQVEFVKAVASRIGGIVPVVNMNELPAAFTNVRLKSGSFQFKSHHSEFCDRLKEIIEDL